MKINCTYPINRTSTSPIPSDGQPTPFSVLNQEEEEEEEVNLILKPKKRLRFCLKLNIKISASLSGTYTSLQAYFLLRTGAILTL